MRKVVAVVALVSSSIACGGFLGFGEDDDLPAPPPPVADSGGLDATVTVDSSDGETNVEPLPPGCKRYAFDPKQSSDVDALLVTQGWNSNVIGNTSMAIENDQLVLRSTGVGTSIYDEANVSFRHDGKIAKITCNTNIAVSSFADNSRFVSMRLYEPRWEPWFEAYVQWTNGQVTAPTQGVYTGDGGRADIFPAPQAAPPTNQKLALSLEVVSEPPSFHVKLGNLDIEHTPIAFGPPEVARVIFGTHTNPDSDAGAYEVRYDAIECIVCDVQ